MIQTTEKNLGIRFLQCLSKIKGWTYHNKIGTEKKNEIKEFINAYIFKTMYGEDLNRKISYNNFDSLVRHPKFKPSIKAILILLEHSNDEKEFHKEFQKVQST